MAINVIVTGFYSSGSSAIIDFLTDLGDVAVCDEDEVRFLQDPYGISDLEYNLIENPHRHNSSQSIKAFMRAVDRLQPKKKKKGPYYAMFNGQFRALSYEFLNELIDFSFCGYNHNDVNSLTPFRLFDYKIRRKIIVSLTRDVRRNFFPKSIDYCAWPTEQKFIRAVNNYLNKLSLAANPDHKRIVVFDQLFPTSNLDRYIRYFGESKTILVNRDPRDVYLNTVEKIHDHVIPTKDINQFCEWYEHTREQNAHVNTDSILEVNFEDLVLDFQRTAARVCSFLGVPFDSQQHIFKKFNPSVSEKNVNQKRFFINRTSEIAVIEQKLKHYLYSF